MAVQAIMGRKVGMTQIFDDKGRAVPVSVIEAGPCVITQIKTDDKDGYTAVQLGYEEIPARKATKPMKGHFGKAGVAAQRVLRELAVDSIEGLSCGLQIGVMDVFQAGDQVKVTGTSKGRGYAGVVKRYHFRGGDKTHGGNAERKPQSSGATDAARTFKGTRKPGRMGNDTVTQSGMTVERVDAERNLILVRGGVPGANGGLIVIALEKRG